MESKTDTQASTTGGNVMLETESSCKDFLFPEYEIVTEPEDEAACEDEVEKVEAEKMKEYAEFVKKSDGELSKNFKFYHLKLVSCVLMCR